MINNRHDWPPICINSHRSGILNVGKCTVMAPEHSYIIWTEAAKCSNYITKPLKSFMLNNTRVLSQQNTTKPPGFSCNEIDFLSDNQFYYNSIFLLLCITTAIYLYAFLTDTLLPIISRYAKWWFFFLVYGLHSNSWKRLDRKACPQNDFCMCEIQLQAFAIFSQNIFKKSSRTGDMPKNVCRILFPFRFTFMLHFAQYFIRTLTERIYHWGALNNVVRLSNDCRTLQQVQEQEKVEKVK